jgi:hypothetical protein
LSFELLGPVSHSFCRKTGKNLENLVMTLGRYTFRPQLGRSSHHSKNRYVTLARRISLLMMGVVLGGLLPMFRSVLFLTSYMDI